MSAITDFLKAELKLMRKSRCANRLNGWYSTSHFVLKNGRQFEPTLALPDGVEAKQPGMCFKNAAEMAIDSSEFIYCEGYGLSIIPVLHAWCLDEDGRVIDPTWASFPFEKGREYFGIAIKTKYVIAHLLETERWGSLIDAWTTHWPMLHDDRDLWRHPIMDRNEVAA